MPAKIRPLNVVVMRDTKADNTLRAQAGLPDSDHRHPARIWPGMSPSPEHDLIYHGGKTIPHLQFTILYVGGNDWRLSDMREIDLNINTAMQEERLNHVIQQYFANEPITTRFLGSQVLAGPAPRICSKGDIAQWVTEMYQAGRLSGHELENTALCFCLPSGSVLTDDDHQVHTLPEYRHHNPVEPDKGFPQIPNDEEVDSLHGLGGYHGSIHLVGGRGEQATIYYCVACYSEQRADGTRNGLPVFEESWKNVIATLYHELQEIRTDPDVEDAIKAGMQPGALDYLGWVSRQGEEIGDFPINAAAPMEQVFQEVRLSGGTDSVPVQLMYSNAVHGAEGPIDSPHEPASLHEPHAPGQPGPHQQSYS